MTKNLEDKTKESFNFRKFLMKIGKPLLVPIFCTLVGGAAIADEDPFKKHNIPAFFKGYRENAKRTIKNKEELYPEEKYALESDYGKNYQILEYTFSDGSKVWELYKNETDEEPSFYGFYDSDGNYIALIDDKDKDGLNCSKKEKDRLSNESEDRDEREPMIESPKIIDERA